MEDTSAVARLELKSANRRMIQCPAWTGKRLRCRRDPAVHDATGLPDFALPEGRVHTQPIRRGVHYTSLTKDSSMAVTEGHTCISTNSTRPEFLDFHPAIRRYLVAGYGPDPRLLFPRRSPYANANH